MNPDWQNDPELLAMARAKERWRAWLNSAEGRAELAKLRRRDFYDFVETIVWIVAGAVLAGIGIIIMAW